MSDEKDLSKTADQLSELIASSEDPFLLVARDGSVLWANNASSNLSRLADVVRQQMPRTMLETPGSRWRGEVAIEDGSASATFDVQVICGDSTLAIHARDITASVRLQQQLAHLASHDPLTDLPNRAQLLRRLADAIERARDRDAALAVLYIDIDDLKKINDNAGHDLGDELIAAVGRRLVAAVRPDDVVARIGGDEFAIVSEGVENEESARVLAERVRRTVSGPVDLPGIDMDLSVSIGVVIYRGAQGTRSDDITPDSAWPDGIGRLRETANSLLRDADKAMYSAKSRGKSRCELYTEDMRVAERERSRLVDDLHRVIELDQLFLEYQPIVSPHSRHVVAAEALVRWRHPLLGVLAPTAFIGLAEDSGASIALGDWILRRAARGLRTWIDQGRVDGRFAMHVNVSRLQVLDRDFAETVLNAIGDAGLRPAQFVLEFNEEILFGDDGRAARSLQSLRRRGVRVSIDDFGAGTSSLTGLRTCPVDFVKLDGTLVRGLGEGDRDEPVVRSVIQLAHGMDASVIAESVTTSVQLERLVALGCDLVQGFHIGRPRPEADFAAGTATVFSA